MNIYQRFVLTIHPKIKSFVVVTQSKEIEFSRQKYYTEDKTIII